MRLARIVGALVALVLTATFGPALVAPADAMAKPKQVITGLTGGEIRNTNDFYLKGRVETFPNGRIKVLRNVSGGAYHTLKKVRTNKRGGFRTSVSQVGRKKTCFKIQVPGTATYQRTTTAVIGCIVKD